MLQKEIYDLLLETSERLTGSKSKRKAVIVTVRLTPFLWRLVKLNKKEINDNLPDITYEMCKNDLHRIETEGLD